MVRTNISRPIQSVPKGYRRQGARFFLEKSTAAASSRQAHPASATAARTRKQTAPRTAAVFLRFPQIPLCSWSFCAKRPFRRCVIGPIMYCFLSSCSNFQFLSRFLACL